MDVVAWLKNIWFFWIFPKMNEKLRKFLNQIWKRISFSKFDLAMQQSPENG